MANIRVVEFQAPGRAKPVSSSVPPTTESSALFDHLPRIILSDLAKKEFLLSRVRDAETESLPTSVTWKTMLFMPFSSSLKRTRFSP